MNVEVSSSNLKIHQCESPNDEGLRPGIDWLVWDSVRNISANPQMITSH
jgi:hypothetical protein